jgi:hypothetical protein
MAKKRELPVVSVIDRRVLHPFGAPSVPITLKDGRKWAVRIVNDHVRTGRSYQVIQMGWEYVTPDELDGTPANFGFRVQDGRLVRGEHGEDVLVKMPSEDFERIMNAKRDRTLASLGNNKAKHEVASATAAQYGDQAGETVYNANIDVTDSRERMELDD